MRSDGHFGRPCLECGELINSADDIEFHLHETGLPGRIYRDALRRQQEQAAPISAAVPAEKRHDSS